MLNKYLETLTPKKAALVGFCFSLPFTLMNLIIALRIEPIYSYLGSFPAIRNSSLTPLLLLLLFPIGAFIAVSPMLLKTKLKRKLHLGNILIAVILSVVFVVVGSALGEETYRCDILKIPNCD